MYSETESRTERRRKEDRGETRRRRKGERRDEKDERRDEEDYFMIYTEQWNRSCQSILSLSGCSSHSSVIKSQNPNNIWILQTSTIPVGSWIFYRTWMEDQPEDRSLIRGHVGLGCPNPNPNPKVQSSPLHLGAITPSRELVMLQLVVLSDLNKRSCSIWKCF